MLKQSWHHKRNLENIKCAEGIDQILIWQERGEFDKYFVKSIKTNKNQDFCVKTKRSAIWFDGAFRDRDKIVDTMNWIHGIFEQKLWERTSSIFSLCFIDKIHSNLLIHLLKKVLMNDTVKWFHEMLLGGTQESLHSLWKTFLREKLIQPFK